MAYTNSVIYFAHGSLFPGSKRTKVHGKQFAARCTKPEDHFKPHTHFAVRAGGFENVTYIVDGQLALAPAGHEVGNAPNARELTVPISSPRRAPGRQRAQRPRVDSAYLKPPQGTG